jgi:alkanesulfonate monooxygenase SsuD/methylene tetrahydromethanopterin reductase-like flavin-dependent oxidoreductase (luciferase family)
MQVGLLAIFQNYQGTLDDRTMVRNELRLAELAEPLGFDTFWPTEHHFTDYSASPDNIVLLSWLAGRTKTIKLGTGAVIVPWNNPLRVVEKIVLLDHLSGGRAILGLGRGLARVEYEHFGIPMDAARGRFDEGAKMIIEALESGFVEGPGPCFPQVRTEVRPRPLAGFKDRLYCVGVSPESVLKCAELGARLMVFSQQPWETFASGALTEYRKAYRSHHGRDPLPPLTGDLMFCHHDSATARELAMKFMSNYFLTIVQHYELMSEHFRKAKGYEFYASAGEMFKAVGLEDAVKVYCSIQTWGTPGEILEKLAWRRRLLGDFELNMICNYGGMTVDEAESSVRLFAKEVIPELHRW